MAKQTEPTEQQIAALAETLTRDLNLGISRSHEEIRRQARQNTELVKSMLIFQQNPSESNKTNFHNILDKQVNIKHDLSFNLRLQPITDRYNQSMLQSFNKTCRAGLGIVNARLIKLLIVVYIILLKLLAELLCLKILIKIMVIII